MFLTLASHKCCFGLEGHVSKAFAFGNQMLVGHGLASREHRKQLAIDYIMNER